MNPGPRTWTLAQLHEEHCADVGQCWEWQSSFNSGGHPQMSYQCKPTLARRVAWVLHKNVPMDSIKGLRMWNVCANFRCINPACTRVGTYRQMFDALVEQGRTASSLSKRAACARVKRAASDLSYDDVREIRRAVEQGIPRKDLAAKYRKSDSTINDIVNFKTWRETVGPASIFSMGGRA